MNDYSNYCSKYSKDDTNGFEKKMGVSKSLVNWQCEICTYINAGGSSECEICGASKPYDPYNSHDNSGSNYFSVSSLKVGNVIDCKDMRGVWYPAKVIKKSADQITVHFRGWSDEFDEILNLKDDIDRYRVSEYELQKKYYGLHKYTIHHFNKEKIQELLILKMRDEKISKEYPINSRVYLDIMDGLYECTVIGINEIEETADVILEKEVLRSIPINYLNKNKKKNQRVNNLRKDGEDEVNGVIINTTKAPLECESSIDKITNSFISDSNRQTIYSNENVGDQIFL